MTAHVTFDLETLGVGPKAPIVQIAAVRFDSEGGVIGQFSRRLDPTSHWKLFEADYSTISWWMKQKQQVQHSVFSSSVPIKDGLSHFHKWVKAVQEDAQYAVKFWSHATFDPPILSHAFKTVKLECPIPYKDFLDIRTLQFLSGSVKVKPPELAHDALVDCKHQAEYIAAMLGKLKRKS